MCVAFMFLCFFTETEMLVITQHRQAMSSFSLISFFPLYLFVNIYNVYILLLFPRPFPCLFFVFPVTVCFPCRLSIMFQFYEKKFLQYLVVCLKGSTFAPAFGKGAAIFEWM